MADWNPSLYLQFGAERTRPAAELLARVPLDEAATIADLGWGPGNSIAGLLLTSPGSITPLPCSRKHAPPYPIAIL